MSRVHKVAVAGLLAACGAAAAYAAEYQRRSAAEALAEPFIGVTESGTPAEGLFEISTTGVSTLPVIDAARTFLESLEEAQHSKTTFAADSIEWRDWHNIHRYERKGIARWEMSEVQEEAALDLLRATSCGSTKRSVS